MSAKELQINGKSFVPGFGMKFFRLLSERWGVASINGVIARLSVLDSITDDVTFEQIDTIADMISVSVQANSDNTEVITADEISEIFLKDVDSVTKIVEQVMKGFMESLPKAKPVGKPKAVK